MKVEELEKLRGLRASDRTPEEQEAINEVMGYENPDSIDLRSVQIQPSTTPQEPLFLKMHFLGIEKLVEIMRILCLNNIN